MAKKIKPKKEKKQELDEKVLLEKYGKDRSFDFEFLINKMLLSKPKNEEKK